MNLVIDNVNENHVEIHFLDGRVAYVDRRFYGSVIGKTWTIKTSSGDKLFINCRRSGEYLHSLVLGRKLKGYERLRFKDGNCLNCKAENIEVYVMEGARPETIKKIERQRKRFEKQMRRMGIWTTC